MATRIRLRRTGKKKQVFYRIVVADSRSPRDGRFIEILGNYNPKGNPPQIEIDEGRTLYWLKNGAMPTDTVRSLLSKKGILAMLAEEMPGHSVLKRPPKKSKAVMESRRPPVTEEETPAEAAAEAPEVVVEEVADDVSAEAPEEVVEEVAGDAPEESAEEVVEETTEEASTSEEVAEEVTGDVAEEPAEEAVEAETAETVEEAPEEVVEAEVAETVEEAPEEVVEAEAAEIVEEAPEEVQEDTSKEAPASEKVDDEHGDKTEE